METIRLVIVAVGGQGNLLASRILGEAALASGIPVRYSEIHGMAQRGGVVESAMVFGRAESNIISDGEADLLVGFEPLETLRAIRRARKNATVITNTSPLPPFTVSIGRGEYPAVEKIISMIESKIERLIPLDATGRAADAGNILATNMVLLGALVATGILPVSEEAVRDALLRLTRPAFHEVNQKALSAGKEAVLSG